MAADCITRTNTRKFRDRGTAVPFWWHNGNRIWKGHDYKVKNRQNEKWHFPSTFPGVLVRYYNMIFIFIPQCYRYYSCSWILNTWLLYIIWSDFYKAFQVEPSVLETGGSGTYSAIIRRLHFHGAVQCMTLFAAIARSVHLSHATFP